MDNFTWLMADLLREQRERMLATQRPPILPEGPESAGLRHALGSRLVRLGLRLDPAAGEGLGTYELTIAHPQAR